MPIYEYDCVECGEPFKKLVRASTQKSEIACPSCGSANAKKKLSVMAASVRNTINVSAPAPVCSPGGT